MNKMFGFGFRLLRENGDGGSGGAGGADGEGDKKPDDQGESKPKDAATVEFEKWFGEQPKEVQDKFNALPKDAQTFYIEQTTGLRKALTSERDMNKTSKTRLTALEQAEQDRKKAAMTELERTKTEKEEATAKVTSLEKDLETNRIESAVMFEAAKLNFVTPEDAIKLLDRTALKVDPETKKVVGVAEALTALSKAKPYLIEPEKKETRLGNAIKRNQQKQAEEGEQKQATPHIQL